MSALHGHVWLWAHLRISLQFRIHLLWFGLHYRSTRHIRVINTGGGRVGIGFICADLETMPTHPNLPDRNAHWKLPPPPNCCCCRIIPANAASGGLWFHRGKLDPSCCGWCGLQEKREAADINKVRLGCWHWKKHTMKWSWRLISQKFMKTWRHS